MMQRKSFAIVAMLASVLMFAACGDEDGTGDGSTDTGVTDTGGEEEDTTEEDTSVTDTGQPDEDTGQPDEDTGPTDTGAEDTGGEEDTGAEDTGGDQDTGGEDTGVDPDTAMDTGNGGETGPPAYEVVNCGGASPATTVDVVNNSFQPDQVTISKGEVVQWSWQQGSHSVTSGSGCTPDGNFNSSVQSSGNYCVRFNTTGTVPYYCIPHCSLGMDGTVEVTQ